MHQAPGTVLATSVASEPRSIGEVTDTISNTSSGSGLGSGVGDGEGADVGVSSANRFGSGLGVVSGVGLGVVSDSGRGFSAGLGTGVAVGAQPVVIIAEKHAKIVIRNICHPIFTSISFSSPQFLLLSLTGYCHARAIKRWSLQKTTYPPGLAADGLNLFKNLIDIS